jgi:hypothetical protein
MAYFVMVLISMCVRFRYLTIKINPLGGEPYSPGWEIGTYWTLRL